MRTATLFLSSLALALATSPHFPKRKNEAARVPPSAPNGADGFGPLPEGAAAHSPTDDDQPPRTYKNHKVYLLQVDNEMHRSFLEAAELDKDGPRLWGRPAVGSNVTVVVPPDRAAHMEEKFRGMRMQHKLLTHNFKEWLDREERSIQASKMGPVKDHSNFRLDTYHTFEEIQNYLDRLEWRAPKLVKVVELGRTYKNNSIRGVIVSTGVGGGPEKQIVYLDGGTHAREWISVSTMLYLIESLIMESAGPELSSLLMKYDFHLVPLVNPDGYIYSWKKDRLWRKNRARTGYVPYCTGVDINRNFDYYWGSETANSQRCSETYAGKNAFSEPESRAIRDHILKHRQHIKFYMSLHSFGQCLLVPFGAGPTKVSRHFSEQMSAARVFQEVVHNRAGVLYGFGATRVKMYNASGLSTDWVHGEGVPYTYTLELRDLGETKFKLPTDQILPTAIEVYEGLKALLFYIGPSPPPKGKYSTSRPFTDRPSGRTTSNSAGGRTSG